MRSTFKATAVAFATAAFMAHGSALAVQGSVHAQEGPLETVVAPNAPAIVLGAPVRATRPDEPLRLVVPIVEGEADAATRVPLQVRIADMVPFQQPGIGERVFVEVISLPDGRRAIELRSVNPIAGLKRITLTAVWGQVNYARRTYSFDAIATSAAPAVSAPAPTPVQPAASAAVPPPAVRLPAAPALLTPPSAELAPLAPSSAPTEPVPSAVAAPPAAPEPAAVSPAPAPVAPPAPLTPAPPPAPIPAQADLPAAPPPPPALPAVTVARPDAGALPFLGATAAPEPARAVAPRTTPIPAPRDALKVARSDARGLQGEVKATAQQLALNEAQAQAQALDQQVLSLKRMLALQEKSIEDKQRELDAVAAAPNASMGQATADPKALPDDAAIAKVPTVEAPVAATKDARHPEPWVLALGAVGIAALLWLALRQRRKASLSSSVSP